jgi:hypothetical protein
MVTADAMMMERPSLGRWYEATHRGDGTRWLAPRDERGLVVVMAARGVTHRLISAAEASKDYRRGEVYHDQPLAEEQYRLARALAAVKARIRGGRYDVAA